jgi:hypothetical protein
MTRCVCTQSWIIYIYIYSHYVPEQFRLSALYTSWRCWGTRTLLAKF